MKNLKSQRSNITGQKKELVIFRASSKHAYLWQTLLESDLAPRTSDVHMYPLLVGCISEWPPMPL